MTDSHVTRPSLLVQMRDARNQCAWGEFVEIYSPLVYGFARKRGLQDADAVDVTQDVLGIVSRSIGKFDYARERGSFRGWLFTIVRHELHDWFAKQRSAAIGAGNSLEAQQFEDLPDTNHSLSKLWNLEHEQRLFAWAAEKVRLEVQETTWKAFWKTTVENQSGQEVATELQMSVAAVYLAKSRVMARLKELVQQAES
jgi:RNA polymerase sigma factor (sigma-70 family)